MDSGYFNPYTDQHFLGFFWVLLKRFFAFAMGEFPLSALVSDEIQILVLLGVALSGALVGTFLVLRRMSMLANALSHTILLGIVTVYLVIMGVGSFTGPQEMLSLPLLIVAALLTGVLTTFLTEFLNTRLQLQKDASIGLVFTTLFAIGILLVTLFTRNLHIGTELIMGNVDALKIEDLAIVYMALAFNILSFSLFFKEFEITTFDGALSRAFGISPRLFNYFLMILTSLTAIGAFRAVGVLMVLAFFVIPVLTARLFTNRLSSLIFLAMGVGALAATCGVAFSRHILTTFGLGLSTGGLTVCTLVAFYTVAILSRPLFVRWTLTT